MQVISLRRGNALIVHDQDDDQVESSLVVKVLGATGIDAVKGGTYVIVRCAPDNILKVRDSDG